VPDWPYPSWVLMFSPLKRLIEGMRECRYPKIVTARSLEEIEMMLDPTVFSVSGVIANTLTEYKHLPVINSLTKAELLVDLIERQFLSPISSVMYDVYAEEKENGAV